MIYLGQYIQKHLAILVVFENRLAPIASGGDVVKGTGKLDTQRSSHVHSLAQHGKCYNARTDPDLPDPDLPQCEN